MSSANHDTLRMRRAKQIVSADLRSYDLLSRQSKTRRTHEHELVNDTSLQYGPELGYVCGHRVSLTQSCDRCKRSNKDCEAYRVALRNDLKAMLGRLK